MTTPIFIDRLWIVTFAKGDNINLLIRGKAAAVKSLFKVETAPKNLVQGAKGIGHGNRKKK